MRSTAAPLSGLGPDVLPGGAKGTRTPDPLLAKYAQAVGYRRSPGACSHGESARIGPCRMPLWSGLVVSLGSIAIDGSASPATVCDSWLVSMERLEAGEWLSC